MNNIGAEPCYGEWPGCGCEWGMVHAARSSTDYIRQYEIRVQFRKDQEAEDPCQDGHSWDLEYMECDDCSAKCEIREVVTMGVRNMHDPVEMALEFALCYGSIEGDHHKMWVIDQMVRALTGDGYEQWIIGAKDGEDGPDTYEWTVGIAP